VPFGAVDEAFAAAAGEGDRTLAWWGRAGGEPELGLIELHPFSSPYEDLRLRTGDGAFGPTTRRRAQ